MIEDLKYIVVSNNLQKDILHDLGGVPLENIDAAQNGSKREFPCPKCGGNTRFRVLDLEHGSIYCSHCCKNKDEGSGDIIGAVKWGQGLANAGDAARMVKKWLFKRGYISDAPRKKLTMDGRDMTTRRQDDTAHASSALNITAQNVEYSEYTEHFTGKVIKTTYFHRLDPRSNFASTLKRDDFDTPKPDNKKTVWELLEKDAHGASVYAPYIAGGATSTKKPPLDLLPQLWKRVYSASRLYIVEGEKCADSFKKALISCDFKGEVLTLGSAGQAQFWGDTSQDWANWARFISKHNATAEIWVFGDNDKPGRNAVKTTAAAFHAAGFKSIMLMDMKLRPDGNPAPEKYDIADWLDEIPLTSLKAEIGRLFDTAREYDPIQAEYEKRVFEALEIRLQILERQERARVEREAFGFDYHDDNKSFPSDIIPYRYAEPLKKLCGKFRVPLGIGNFFLDSILSAIIGPYKCKIHVSDDVSNCQLLGLVVGNSGAGKSQVIKRLLNLVEPFKKELSDSFNALVNREPLIKKELEKKLEEGSCAEEIEKLQKKLRLINQTSPLFVVSAFTSVASLRLTGAVNCQLRELDGKPLPGMYLFFDDALKLLGTAGTTSLDVTTMTNLKGVFALTDFDLNHTELASDKERGKIARERIGASECFIIQPKTFKAWFSESIAGVGAFQRARLFYCERPKSDPKNPVDPCTKFRDELNPIGDLFTMAWNWRGGDVKASIEYQTAYTSWFNEVDKMYDELTAKGEIFAAGWIAKRQSDIHAEAFLQHVKKHVANGGKLDSLPEMPESVFNDAAKLFEYELESARRTAAIMDGTAFISKKSTVTNDAAIIPTKTKGVYDDAIAAGSPCDLTPGDALGRSLTVKELTNKSYYRSNRETVEETLVKHGLLIIDPHKKGRNDKGLRVFIPDNLTLEEVRRIVATLEGDDLEKDENLEESLDFASDADVSLNGIDETPRQNREKEKTFSEFDQYAPADPYDDDVPF